MVHREGSVYGSRWNFCLFLGLLLCSLAVSESGQAGSKRERWQRSPKAKSDHSPCLSSLEKSPSLEWVRERMTLALKTLQALTLKPNPESPALLADRTFQEDLLILGELRLDSGVEPQQRQSVHSLLSQVLNAIELIERSRISGNAEDSEKLSRQYQESVFSRNFTAAQDAFRKEAQSLIELASSELFQVDWDYETRFRRLMTIGVQSLMRQGGDSFQLRYTVEHYLRELENTLAEIASVKHVRDMLNEIDRLFEPVSLDEAYAFGNAIQIFFSKQPEHPWVHSLRRSLEKLASKDELIWKDGLREISVAYRNFESREKEQELVEEALPSREQKQEENQDFYRQIRNLYADILVHFAASFGRYDFQNRMQKHLSFELFPAEPRTLRTRETRGIVGKLQSKDVLTARALGFKPLLLDLGLAREVLYEATEIYETEKEGEFRKALGESLIQWRDELAQFLEKPLLSPDEVRPVFFVFAEIVKSIEWVRDDRFEATNKVKLGEEDLQDALSLYQKGLEKLVSQDPSEGLRNPATEMKTVGGRETREEMLRALGSIRCVSKQAIAALSPEFQKKFFQDLVMIRARTQYWSEDVVLTLAWEHAFAKLSLSLALAHADTHGELDSNWEDVLHTLSPAYWSMNPRQAVSMIQILENVASRNTQMEIEDEVVLEEGLVVGGSKRGTLRAALFSGNTYQQTKAFSFLNGVYAYVLARYPEEPSIHHSTGDTGAEEEESRFSFIPDAGETRIDNDLIGIRRHIHLEKK